MPTTTETIPYQAVRRGARRRAEHIMREGITVGLIGAAVAMLLFLGVDLADAASRYNDGCPKCGGTPCVCPR